MRSTNCISALVSSFLLFFAVPCLGEDLTPSASFPLPWDHLGPGFDNRSSATMLSDGILKERRLAEGAVPLRFSKAEESTNVDEDFEDYPEEEPVGYISDPIEPVNRVFFHFNDKLYFWVFKPVATGYKHVVPEPARVSIRGFFSNLTMPIRAVNCLLQGKFKGFGNELLRFFVNSTAGCLGFQDVAKMSMGIEKNGEDFGQTLGAYGLGPGFYITWPFLGPSSIRGTFGLVGDYFLDPISYVDPTITRIAIKAEDRVNSTSLRLGEYEALKKAALDPYVSVRDAYYQYRESKIKE